jgi:hypothetical protein
VKINIIGFDASRDLTRIETRASRGANAVNEYGKDSSINLCRGAKPRGLFCTRLKISLVYDVVDMENNISTWKLFSGDDASGFGRVARVLLKALNDLF